PLDPRVIRMHANIEEFLSLSAFLRATSAEMVWRFAIGFILTLPALLVFRRRGNGRILLAFVASVAVASVGLACWQVRWWLTASGPQLVLLLAACSLVFSAWTARARWVAVLVISAVFVEQAAARVQLTRTNVANRAVSSADA